MRGVRMDMTLEITGLCPERLLTMAVESGLLIRRVYRLDERHIRLRVPVSQSRDFLALCARYGWESRVISSGMLLRCASCVRRRPMALAGALLYVLLMAMSSRMIWQIRMDHAGKDAGEIRRYLQEKQIIPGRLKSTVSPSRIQDDLMLRLPDLAYVTVSYEGSRLVIDCQASLEEESTWTPGRELDLVAAQDGLITGMVVRSGTPAVSIGQAVHAGDVLIRGEERAQKQSMTPVMAQGEVTARVWARGNARVSRYKTRTVETGAVRRRVTVVSPWHSRVVSDAESFEKQDVSEENQPVVGLYLPLIRRIETYAEVEIFREERAVSDARAMAQGAAEQMAKNKCPSGVHILDKSVENSMIDNEYVYAAVVLEYETGIAVRRDHDEMIR